LSNIKERLVPELGQFGELVATGRVEEVREDRSVGRSGFSNSVHIANDYVFMSKERKGMVKVRVSAKNRIQVKAGQKVKKLVDPVIMPMSIRQGTSNLPAYALFVKDIVFEN